MIPFLMRQPEWLKRSNDMARDSAIRSVAPPASNAKLEREEELKEELLARGNIDGRYVSAINNGQYFHGRIKLRIPAPPGRLLVEDATTGVCWSSWVSNIAFLNN